VELLGEQGLVTGGVDLKAATVGVVGCLVAGRVAWPRQQASTVARRAALGSSQEAWR
jgi:hypothetical protein